MNLRVRNTSVYYKISVNRVGANNIPMESAWTSSKACITQSVERMSLSWI